MPRPDTFTVPEFHLPFEDRTAPGGGRANAGATAWAVDRGLIEAEAAEQFAGIGFGHLAARVGHGASPDELLLLARWMAWSFVLDDQHDLLIRTGRLDDWRPLSDAMAHHVAGGPADVPAAVRDNPLVSSFTELCDRALAGMAPPLRSRYRRHVPRMLRSLDEEAANRRPGHRPTVEEYVLTRRHSSQLLPMMDMVEAARGVEVPDEADASPALRELAWSAVDVISWGNDVFSFPKEHSCGDTNNLVALLVRWHGLTPAEAVRAVAERVRARVEDFLAAARDLPRALDALGVTDPAARTAVEHRVRGYQDWMIGTDLWQRHDCTRYRDERFAAGLEAAYTRPDLVPAT
ncbi:terpene synthase family protein [Streptomyces sudanensis]|uniref:terpene synthase family protein n=1 Tax=Streptomyces sudanensis TaxID=436397 RepID=UPI0020CD1295|nr:lyase [Streptomyces sudanensis]MCP9956332.1 lyase [Streptomyces sudanensis]MCQ0003050.1 lyase [Streptomyces sudanensis]